MPAFLETPRFPGFPNWGVTKEVDYGISKGQAGRRTIRNRAYAEPLHKYTFQIGPKRADQIAALDEFFHAMGSEEGEFRFKDWSDYKSCRVTQAVSPTDQPLLQIDSTHFQLVKQYVAGAASTVRTIAKPVANTVRVANEVGAEQAASGKWSIDLTTGILTKLGGFTGTPTTAGFEFDVPVAFDGPMPVELLDFQIQSATCTLVEIDPEALT